MTHKTDFKRSLRRKSVFAVFAPVFSFCRSRLCPFPDRLFFRFFRRLFQLARFRRQIGFHPFQRLEEPVQFPARQSLGQEIQHMLVFHLDLVIQHAAGRHDKQRKRPLVPWIRLAYQQRFLHEFVHQDLHVIRVLVDQLGQLLLGHALVLEDRPQHHPLLRRDFVLFEACRQAMVDFPRRRADAVTQGIFLVHVLFSHSIYS